MDAESRTEHNFFGGKHITELTDEDIAKGDSWSAMRKFQDRANKDPMSFSKFMYIFI
jgi:hypothetical protein